MAYNNKNKIEKSKVINAEITRWVANGRSIKEYYWEKIYSDPKTRMSWSQFYKIINLDVKNTPKYNCNYCCFVNACKMNTKDCLIKN